MQKRVITIQDISCIGKCSLTVALPILSAAGLETSILPTAILSTHTGGFTGYTFRDLTEDVLPITEHWKSLDVKTNAIYTGYLGSDEQLKLVAGIFDDFRSDNTLVFVDPAMADQGKLYPAFDLEFARGMGNLCAKADVIVPNLTEACLILGIDYPGEEYSREFIEKILKDLTALGPNTAVLTGISFEEGKLGAIAYRASEDDLVEYYTQRVPGYYHGTGDIYSSVLLGALLNEKSVYDAIRIACEFTVGAIRLSYAAQTDPKYGVDFENQLPELIKLLSLG